ncbi:hypothetical protein HY993_03690 [Candidatus Micrarchaeota archaeon]|nr:hypothetical protein [Candidatus Micrarchaeota archaeon]
MAREKKRDWTWDLGKIARRVREFHNAGHAVNARAMQDAGGEKAYLHNHAVSKVASWDEVLKKAGLDPQKIRKPTHETKYSWAGDLGKMAKRVKEWHESGSKVNVRAMTEAKGEKNALYSHATKKLGLTWDEVLKKAGLNPREIRRKQNYPWQESLELVLARIAQLHGEKVDLSAAKASNSSGELLALFNHVKKTRKTRWGEALRKAGVDTSKMPVWGKWGWMNDEQKIIERLNHWNWQGHKLNYAALKNDAEKRAMYYHVTQKMGVRWKRMLEKAGVAKIK